MGKTLAELLADAASSDDLEFTIPDGTKFKLGDVRLFKAGMTAEEKKLQAKQTEAERIASEAKKLLDTLDAAMKEEDAKRKKAGEPADHSGDWKKNPLYEDLVPVFEALTAQVTESRNIAAAAKRELAQSSSFYAIERMRREYDAAPESFRKANTFEAVVTAALSSGDVESYGQGENLLRMPTLRKRIHEGTEADRITAATTAAVAAAKVEWDKQAKLNSVTKPQGRFATKTASSEKPPIAKLDELTSEKIMNDPDITAAMEGPAN